LIAKYIKDHCGIEIPQEKSYLIENRLSRLLSDFNLSGFEELYARIAGHRDKDIEEKVIDAITTNETFWFRDQSPWDILENKLLPGYIDEIRKGKRTKVRIWSAACSTGQEPYSTAMCIDNYLTMKGIHDIDSSKFEILATDISNNVLKTARAGQYDNISVMRGLDESYRQKYFTYSGGFWKLSDGIVSAVRFQQFNLLNSALLLGKFDIVFCRYVLIYFSEGLKRNILEKIHTVLEDGGVLFIGNSELMAESHHLFQKVKEDSNIYYIKR